MRPLTTCPAIRWWSTTAPQLALLERAAVLITHAGLNTVLEAISRGVPMVALPRNTDQPGIAARIAHAGAGLYAPFAGGVPQDVRNAIQRVLSEDRFRERAQELKQAMLAAGGARARRRSSRKRCLRGAPYCGANDAPRTAVTTVRNFQVPNPKS